MSSFITVSICEWNWHIHGKNFSTDEDYCSFMFFLLQLGCLWEAWIYRSSVFAWRRRVQGLERLGRLQWRTSVFTTYIRCKLKKANGLTLALFLNNKWLTFEFWFFFPNRIFQMLTWSCTVKKTLDPKVPVLTYWELSLT